MPKININLNIRYPTFIEQIVVFFLLRYRKRHYGIAFRRIKLAKGRYTIVDAEDYEKLAGENWQLYEKENKGSYAIRLEGRRIISMHRVIMDAPKGKVVHHRDGTGLNNTKENLQIVTMSENNRCCRKRGRPASSKYKGVNLDKRYGRWRAGIKYGGKYEHLGCFGNEEKAARAYDEAAKKYHGEYAVLNFEEDKNKEQRERIKRATGKNPKQIQKFRCSKTVLFNAGRVHYNLILFILRHIVEMYMAVLVVVVDT